MRQNKRIKICWKIFNFSLVGVRVSSSHYLFMVNIVLGIGRFLNGMFGLLKLSGVVLTGIWSWLSCSLSSSAIVFVCALWKKLVVHL